MQDVAVVVEGKYLELKCIVISDVQFLRISSATVCWVLPSDLAIVASLSPLLSPASICSLSS